MKSQVEKLECDLRQCHMEFVIDGDVYTDYKATAENLMRRGWRKRNEGKWVKHDSDCEETYYTCSVCEDEGFIIDGTPWEIGLNYCPKCGAKMKGGE